MTQEEKAKAYDEALERARGLLEIVKEDKVEITEEDVKSLFPELAESEDERIKKLLYAYISNCPNESFAFYGGVGKDAVLNYIVRQKEQKSAWSEEDEGIMQTMIKEGDLKPSEIAWLNRIRPSWKPSEEQMKGLKFFLDFHRPQRNAGTTNWREYDAVESLYEQLKKSIEEQEDMIKFARHFAQWGAEHLKK